MLGYLSPPARVGRRDEMKDESVFVRLTGDGDSIVGAFLGDPFAREVVWNGKCYENYNQEVHLQKRSVLRVMLNFYVPAEHRMKVFECGSFLFRDLLRMRDEYGFSRWLFEVHRHGESGDRNTRYFVVPSEQLNSAHIDEISKLNLHDLEELACG